MAYMTGIERIGNILKRKPVDRIGFFEHFWEDTQKAWVQEGWLSKEEDLNDHFGFDIEECGWVTGKGWVCNMIADFNKEPEVVEETEETILLRDGDGALLRRHKQHDATPEHVDFLVKERKDWEENIKPLLTPNTERIDFEGFRKAREHAARKNRFFVWSGPHVFELIKNICGHENMLIGMALDSEWIADMVETYSCLIIKLQEILFSEAGKPDGIWYYEDMGFKERSFISPSMYREIIQPGHKMTIDFAHSKNLPVIMHSCGMVEPLVPAMIESGIDCLEALEVKSGMDILRLYKNFGDRLSFMGGLDIRVLYSNEKKLIDQELITKIPTVMGKYGFVLHSDHSIPESVKYKTYQYFAEEGLRIGVY